MYQNPLLRLVWLLTFITGISEPVFSQPPDLFSKISPADFELPKSSVITGNSNAVIMVNVGSVEFVGNKKTNWVSYIYKKYTRIKILNRKAFDLATVTIRLYGQDDEQDKMDDFHATTYNLEEGKLTETQLSKSDLFDKKISKSFNEKKFTMPNLKEGCIVEYSYTITSLNFHNMPGWNFQSLEYPCLYSEFKAAIPDLLRFNQIKYGIDSFYSVKSRDEKIRLTMASVAVYTTVHNHTWVMKDIPAFVKEDYITEPRNYLDRIEFSLAQIYNGENVTNYNTTWKSAEDRLLNSLYFGKPIMTNRSENLYNIMKKIAPLDVEDKEAVKKMYTCVRDNFTCEPDNEVYINPDLYEINKSKKGTVAELNMLLIALLRQRGIKADPVILATRSYGVNPESAPVLENLNYVLCMTLIGRDTIFLDASDPSIGFGKIPLDCYNGHARIINDQHSGAIYFYPSDIKETSASSVILINNDKETGESGSLQSTLGYYESNDLRNSVKEAGEEKYLKNIKKGYGPDVDISNFQIDSLHDIDEPVKVNYDITFKNGFDGDIIYFNPVIKAAYKENPFKATDRKYPVELPYPINETYDFTMDIPNGYKVDELPKSVKANFNETEGTFTYQITKDDYTVQLHILLKINKAFFDPEDYNSLRDFFTMVVKKQNEQIVFKKK